MAPVTLTFERTVLDEVSGKLDGRYEAKRKTESGAQNGYAEWTAANGSTELLSARDGRQFTVAYWAKNAKAGISPTAPPPTRSNRPPPRRRRRRRPSLHHSDAGANARHQR